jgi:hypothetical protein
MNLLARYRELGWDLKTIAAGEKRSRLKGWPDLKTDHSDLAHHLDHGGNVAFRTGRSSSNTVDVDLDCAEALALKDIYLLPTGAKFGRVSKPISHWLYLAPGAIFASYADPLDGSMLIELRADGRDGGAHATLIPPSVANDERREWHGDVIEPAAVDAAVLARRVAWLAIGCLVMRHISEHAARRPDYDLPDLLWGADPKLGRAAYHWFAQLSPDEKPPDLKPRRDLSTTELRLEEIVAAISNDFEWHGWNRIGMAIYAASDGSQQGFVVFDDFSSRSAKYRPYAVLERWNNYRRSPPQRISFGTLVHLARQAGRRRSSVA